MFSKEAQSDWTGLYRPIRNRWNWWWLPTPTKAGNQFTLWAGRIVFFFLFFSCLLCIKILLSASSITSSSACLEKNDGGASACESPAIHLMSDKLHLLFGCCTKGGGNLFYSHLFSHVCAPVVKTHHCASLCFYDNSLQIIDCSGWMCACRGRMDSHPCHRKTEGKPFPSRNWVCFENSTPTSVTMLGRLVVRYWVAFVLTQVEFKGQNVQKKKNPIAL